MRTIDEPPDPMPIPGEKVPKPEHDPELDWVPVPDAPDIERNVVTNKRRTRISRNDLANGWWPLCK